MVRERCGVPPTHPCIDAEGTVPFVIPHHHSPGASHLERCSDELGMGSHPPPPLTRRFSFGAVLG